MKKLFLFIFLFALNASVSFSQKIKFSPELKENRNARFMKILGTDENENIFLLRSNLSLDSDREHSGLRAREYYLQFFSNELNLVWEKQLDSPMENGRIVDVQINNNRVVVVSYVADRKSKSYSFFIQAINNKGEWVGAPTSIDQFFAIDLDEDDKPGIINSNDEMTIAFSYRKISSDYKSQFIHVVLIDTAFKNLFTKDIVINSPAKNFIPLSSQLTDDRNFLVLGTRYTTDKRVKSPGEVIYEIYGCNSSHDSNFNAEIKIDGKFLTDVGFSVDNSNHRVIAAGFYSDRSTYSTAGIFYNSFSEDSLVQLSSSSSPFPDSYLAKFIGERKGNKSKELVNYSIDRLIVRKDGGVAIMAESFNRAERSYYDYYIQSFIYHYYYHYGNVMVCSVNPSGEILWGNVISKDQNSVDDGGATSSYHSSIIHGKILSIYNKYIDEDSSVLLTTIDGVGSERTDVLINDIARVSVVPHSAKQIDEDTILMPAYKQNKFQLIRISF